MYCAKCGAQIAEGSNFCGNCGASVTNPVSQPQPAPVPLTSVQPAIAPVAITRTNGFAIASLVLGIAGILFHFLSILAIIFGALAISQIGKNPGLKGKGMAVAGLVLGTIMVIVWVILMVILATSVFLWHV